ncbi:Fc.00g052410.m01.CDS01 [Cosmosporella sp. VM-42]
MSPSAIEAPSVSETLDMKPPHYQSGTSLTPTTQFDAAKHLNFSPPSTVLTMKDLSLEPTALSPIATTEPFPLLSHEAVLQHRRELFSPEVLDNCLHHTRPGSVQLRGMAPRYAPFIHKFWHSPEVLKIVSSIAGVDLVPAMDYEISHTNVQLGPEGLEAVRNTPVEPPIATEEAICSFNKDKSKKQTVTDQTKPIIEWHKDSHPWVCVVMLSDARHMTGGETEIMKGDGTTLKVKAPQMGCAVLLQGRYITHTAAPVTNMPERVTIVTSFRPRDPTILDETTNANVRNKSHLSELYYQWTTYRLDVLAQRARLTADALRKRYEENVKTSDPERKAGLCRVETVSVAEVEQWANEQIKYIQETLYEMRPLIQ